MRYDQKGFFEDIAREEGWCRCSICDSWIRTDEANENDEIWAGEICEDCLDKHYGKELYNVG